MIHPISSDGGPRRLYVYGERPITELFIALASDEDMLVLISKVQLDDGRRIDTSQEKIEKVFIEAPLGKGIGYADFVIMTTSFCVIFEVKPNDHSVVADRLDHQIGRYCKCLEKNGTRSRAELVNKFYESKGRKKTYLVVITRNQNYPSSLFSAIDAREVSRSRLGWAPYSFILLLLRREGFHLEGDGSHIWVEGDLTMRNGSV